MRHRLVLCAFSIIASVAARASVIEDFEDGDYTSNPTWQLEIDQGASFVGDDPVRPNNLTYHAHGTSGGNRSIYTDVGDDVTFTAFRVSFDFLATDAGFHPQWNLATENRAFDIGAGLWRDPSWDVIRLYPAEGGERIISQSVTLDLDQFLLNSWYQISTTYVPSSGNVVTELRQLEGNLLIAQLIYAPVSDLHEAGSPSALWLGTEETQWQMFDNIVLTPEPATLSLIVVALALCIGQRSA